VTLKKAKKQLKKWKQELDFDKEHIVVLFALNKDKVAGVASELGLDAGRLADVFDEIESELQKPMACVEDCVIRHKEQYQDVEDYKTMKRCQD